MTISAARLPWRHWWDRSAAWCWAASWTWVMPGVACGSMPLSWRPDLVLKAICGGHPIAVVGVAVITTLFSGLYLPYWMTAVYNAGKVAPCTFRFHFAAEGGWDAGGVCACLVGAVLCALPRRLRSTFCWPCPWWPRRRCCSTRVTRATNAPARSRQSDAGVFLLKPPAGGYCDVAIEARPEP